ncbi:MAG TPA: 4-aminobutyrate--2-oxoglutarate transaminase [Thermoleophilia bacterium]|nr:4-aminobutyrate--2-oxoglutarate transaminase [Thermoleophilia bacterium]
MTNQELKQARDKNVPRGPFNVTGLFAAKALNATITDVEGRDYIDFAGGIGVMAVGHCHPKVVAATQDQSALFSHTCFHVVMYEAYVELARKMNEAAPGDFDKKTILLNSGAEAVENAVKIARYATGRDAVIAFEDAFHGRTLMTMSLTSKTMPYKKGFGPFAPEIYRLPYAYCYRCPLALEYPGCGVACADLLTDAFKNYVGADEVAAVIAEPVLGEGGFVVPPKEYFPKVKKICEDNGIVFIADEVQSGFGRTGNIFSIDHWGVAPDLITSAKSLAAGYPLSAVTGRAELMDAPHVGGLGGTYGGNPVSCRAALAVFDIIEHDGLLARADVIGARIRASFDSLAGELEVVGDVRGLGAMVALELVTDRGTKAPAADLTKALVTRALEKGVIMISAGTYGNVIRPLMPLTIDDATLDRGLAIVAESLREVAAEAGLA